MAIFYFYPDEPCAIEIGLKIVPILISSSFFARQLSRLSIINNIIITAKTIMPEIVNIAISSLIILAPVLSVAPLKCELPGARGSTWWILRTLEMGSTTAFFAPNISNV